MNATATEESNVLAELDMQMPSLAVERILMHCDYETVNNIRLLNKETNHLVQLYRKKFERRPVKDICLTYYPPTGTTKFVTVDTSETFSPITLNQIELSPDLQSIPKSLLWSIQPVRVHCFADFATVQEHIPTNWFKGMKVLFLLPEVSGTLGQPSSLIFMESEKMKNYFFQDNAIIFMQQTEQTDIIVNSEIFLGLPSARSQERELYMMIRARTLCCQVFRDMLCYVSGNTINIIWRWTFRRLRSYNMFMIYERGENYRTSALFQNRTEMNSLMALLVRCVEQGEWRLTTRRPRAQSAG